VPQPSRTLDRAIAEHVLGVRVEVRELEYVMLDPRQGSEELEVPQFSSDDGAADGLAALLTYRGYEVMSEEFPVRGWQVILVPPAGRLPVEEFAPTFAMALCQAALSAVGAAVPEQGTGFAVVDNKTCSVSETVGGIRFVIRKTDRV
jgi:hypothetical protein